MDRFCGIAGGSVARANDHVLAPHHRSTARPGAYGAARGVVKVRQRGQGPTPPGSTARWWLRYGRTAPECHSRGAPRSRCHWYVTELSPRHGHSWAPSHQDARVTHLEETLQRDIERISGKFREMATLVDTALRGCVQAMTQANRQLAYSVILRDQRIDELEKEIDRLSLEFIVRQQPVGRHLRFAYATIKINSQLERVGDYAESMARQILSLDAIESPVPSDLFLPIANLAIPMVRSAVDAFVNQNPDLARKTIESEDAVDQMRHRLSHELLLMSRDGRIALEALAPLQNILNRFERVADQAKSISQDVLYLCTGEYVKHLGSDVFRVLFVDGENSSASAMAEAIGNSLNQPAFVFSSAGLERKSVEPATMEFLRAKGLESARPNSKSLEQIPYLDQYQIIVALGKDAQSAFPAPPTKVVCLDWSSVYASIDGENADDTAAGLERIYRFLHDHIKDLVEAVLIDDRSPVGK